MWLSSPILPIRRDSAVSQIEKVTGRRFERMSDIQRKSKVVLNNINESDFHSSLQSEKKNRWGHCTRSQADCFERDGSQS